MEKIDLITLDLHLADGNGLMLAREIRARGAVHIVMITAKSDVIDRVLGLEMGADDYVTKPFHVREVLARVHRVLARAVGIGLPGATIPGVRRKPSMPSIVERAVARVNGIKEVRSSSEQDNFRVRAVFDPSTDLITAANDVREAISRVQRDLPTGVEDLTVVKADADAQSIVRLAASSDTLPLEEVTRQVTNEIIPELTSIAGVADVVLFG
jgi:response regulator RpfG family c-di-GMP phosphodiesterase